MGDEGKNIDLEAEKLQIQREHLDLGKKRFVSEQRFMNRYFTTILTATISFVAILFSVTQFILSNRTHKAEMERLDRQHHIDQELANERQKSEWRIKVGAFVAEHEAQVFSTDPKEQRRMVALIRASFPDGVKEDVLTVVESIVPADQKSFYKIARTIEVSARQATSAPLSQSNPTSIQDPAFMQMSLRLQTTLKQRILDNYLSDPARLNDIAAVAPLLVYSAIPPSTSATRSGKRRLSLKHKSEHILGLGRQQFVARADLIFAYPK